MTVTRDSLPKLGEFDCSRRACKVCCKKATAFLFSTVGLVIMAAAYSIAGGFLFQFIEEGNDHSLTVSARTEVAKRREQHLGQLWNITQRYKIVHRDNWTKEVEAVMSQFQKELYNLTTYHNWDGQDANKEIRTKWNLSSAVLYAITAITSIGYGHVTPKTWQGKLVTIFYTLPGLPLAVMCLANVGKFFAQVFRIIYHTICCGVCCVCCITYKREYRINRALREHLANLQLDSGKDRAIRSASNRLLHSRAWLRRVKEKFSLSIRSDTDVPMYLCLVVMALYILGGTLLFSFMEDWDYVTAAYFCFVTLTTIGFGDYVPGVTTNYNGEENMTENLAWCSLYLLCGLSLIGMCIELMQAGVLKKINWIGLKLGMIKGRTLSRSTSYKDLIGAKLSGTESNLSRKSSMASMAMKSSTHTDITEISESALDNSQWFMLHPHDYIAGPPGLQTNYKVRQTSPHPTLPQQQAVDNSCLPKSAIGCNRLLQHPMGFVEKPMDTPL